MIWGLWVNDLYLHDRKVCGILTEAVTDFESGNIEFAVVGIGLNLYVPEEDFQKTYRKRRVHCLEAGRMQNM